MKESDEFENFIGELSESGDLDGAAKGIAAHVGSEGGFDALTRHQHSALVAGVKGWLVAHFEGYKPEFVPYPGRLPQPECTECGVEVPWSEVYIGGSLNEGRCSWCQQVHHKDD